MMDTKEPHKNSGVEKHSREIDDDDDGPTLGFWIDYHDRECPICNPSPAKRKKL